MPNAATVRDSLKVNCRPISYRAVVFAVPAAEISEEGLVKKLVRAAFTPSEWNTIERFPPTWRKGLKPKGSETHAYVPMSSDADARQSGLRYFAIGLNGSGCSYLLVQVRVSALRRGAVTVDGGDARPRRSNGRVLFRAPITHHETKLAWMLTVGPYYGGSMDRFSVEFSQRRYSNDQLAQISGKPEADMTDDEHRAVTEHDDAITIGFRQFFPKARYAEYLSLFASERVWKFNRQDKPRLVPRPARFQGCIDDLPNAGLFRRAGISRH